MTELIPAYTVSYRGSFHPPGVAFQIEDEDAEEMNRHGKIIVQEDDEKPAKRGRPKKM